MPGQDREDALRQGRSDLDTHEFDQPQPTEEEQVRGQRQHRPPQGPERRKPKNG